MSFGIDPRTIESLLELNGVPDFESWTPDKLARSLNTDLNEGLCENEEQLEIRKKAFGVNKLPEKAKKSFWKYCWDALNDLTLIVLIVCGIVSLILGLTIEEDKSTGWIEGASILVAVVIVVLVTAINDYQKEKQFRELSAIKDDVIVSVLRYGKRTQISIFEIVVGDLLFLATGDDVAADGIFIRGHDIKVNNSALTGESKEIEKSAEDDNIIYSGTQIMAGNGIMLIMAVGVRSQVGIISELVRTGGKSKTRRRQRNSEPSAINGDYTESSALLQQPPDIIIESDTDDDDNGDSNDDDDGDMNSVLSAKLDVLAVQIGKFGLAMAILTFLILICRFCIETYAIKHIGFSTEHLTKFLEFFIIGITVLVVAVPEGLPLAVTISLAFSVKKMLKEKNLVRHLDACETMGNATTICSDKTGTLTTNRMTVVASEWANCGHDCINLHNVKLNDAIKKILSQSIAINSTAEVTRSTDGQFNYIGNNTECAILRYLIINDIDYNVLRADYDVKKLCTFSSARKRMAAVIKNDEGEARVLCKGASEIILELCNKVHSEDGIVELTSEVKKKYFKLISKYANKGLRTLAFGYKDLEYQQFEINISDIDFLEDDLILIGIVGIQDPVRPEVPIAIKKCHDAGIVVRMVTGDNIDTARAIAKDCGILSDHEPDVIVMEGPEFRKRVLDENGILNMAAFDQIWPYLRVLARSSPTDKHTLVDGLMKTEHNNNPQVVAVTGDGTNDAPALKRANVGFAMGIQGTEVAKDASDIILMDDNFNSIVAAVKWGRNVYDSVSKFLQFQLTVNVVAILIAVVGSAIVETSPLTAVQMLWVNLIMDTLASLALATEPPTDELLKRKPYPRDKAIISRKMFRFIIGHGLYQSLIVFGMTFASEDMLKAIGVYDNGGLTGTKTPTVHYTMVFNVFVLLQLVNEINARKVHGEWNVFEGMNRNWLYIAIMIGQLLCQVLIVQFGGMAFSCKPLSAKHWGICLGFALVELPINFILQVIPKYIIPYKLKGKKADNDRSIAAQGLWLRSTARVRSAIRVTRSFREGIKDHRTDRIRKTKSEFIPLSKSTDSIRYIQTG